VGPNARNSDILGLADPEDANDLQRMIYMMVGVGIAIAAMIGVVGLGVQFL